MPPPLLDRTGKDKDRPAGPERRYCSPGLRVERREVAGDAPARPVIAGHASVCDQWTTLYDCEYWVWREIVRPGAFTNAIAEKQDVRSLFNHDPNMVLGRTASGTLRLSEDGVGLMTETEPPDTQLARDLLVSIARGDVTGMSIAFAVRPGEVEVTTEKDGAVVTEDSGQRVTVYREGDKLIEERELLDADLFDVSPVTYPAFPQTDLGLRSFAEHRERSLREARRRTPRRDRAGLILRLLEKC